MSSLDLATLLISELAAALLVLCLVLLWHARRQGRGIAALEAEVENQRGELARLNAVLSEPQAPILPPISFGDVVGEQIGATREFHETLGAEHDIALDIAPETPMPRRVLALRHALLLAEQEAWRAGDGETVEWDVLIDRFSPIIEVLHSEGLAPSQSASALGENALMRELLTEWSPQSRDMVGALGTLEQELRELHARLRDPDAEAAAVDVEAASARVQALEARCHAVLNGEADTGDDC